MSGISVIARVRPLLESEKQSDVSIDVDSDGSTVFLKCGARGTARSTMSKRYKMACALKDKSQEDVFKTVLPTLEGVLQGYNTSIFAYGQTGTGKTFTMLGYDLWALANNASACQQSTQKLSITNPTSGIKKKSALSASVGSKQASPTSQNRKDPASPGGYAMRKAKSFSGFSGDEANGSSSSPTQKKMPFMSFVELSASSTYQSSQEGLIPRAIHWLFSKQAQLASTGKLAFRVSYVEIYNESVRDLLAIPIATSPAADDDTDPAIPLWMRARHLPEAAGVLSYYTSGPKLQFGMKSTGKGDPGLQIKLDAQGVVHVPEAVTHDVSNVENVMELLWKGAQMRSTSATDMNAYSSRSHTIFTIYVDKFTSDKSMMQSTKLTFVDLAGSEKIDKYSEQQMNSQQLKELSCINRSLSTLANVVSALSEHSRKGKTKAVSEEEVAAATTEKGFKLDHTHLEEVQQKVHVPYRDSKLTRLMQDSLGGGARTLFICTLSPSQMSLEESASTLMFADRAIKVQLQARPTPVRHVEPLRGSVGATTESAGDATAAALAERYEAQISTLQLTIRFLLDAIHDRGTGKSAKDTYSELLTALQNNDATVLKLTQEIQDYREKLLILQSQLTMTHDESERQRKHYISRMTALATADSESSAVEGAEPNIQKFNLALEESLLLQQERREATKVSLFLKQIVDRHSKRWTWLQSHINALKGLSSADQLQTQISLLENLVATQSRSDRTLVQKLVSGSRRSSSTTSASPSASPGGSISPSSSSSALSQLRGSTRGLARSPSVLSPALSQAVSTSNSPLTVPQL